MLLGTSPLGPCRALAQVRSLEIELDNGLSVPALKRFHEALENLPAEGIHERMKLVRPAPRFYILSAAALEPCLRLIAARPRLKAAVARPEGFFPSSHTSPPN